MVPATCSRILAVFTVKQKTVTTNDMFSKYVLFKKSPTSKGKGMGKGKEGKGRGGRKGRLASHYF